MSQVRYKYTPGKSGRACQKGDDLCQSRTPRPFWPGNNGCNVSAVVIESLSPMIENVVPCSEWKLRNQVCRTYRGRQGAADQFAHPGRSHGPITRCAVRDSRIFEPDSIFDERLQPFLTKDRRPVGFGPLRVFRCPALNGCTQPSAINRQRRSLKSGLQSGFSRTRRNLESIIDE